MFWGNGIIYKNLLNRNNMKSGLIFLSIFLISFAAGYNRSGSKPNTSTPPFIINSHVHYEATDGWEKSFLEIYTRHNAMACLLISMKDLKNWRLTS